MVGYDDIHSQCFKDMVGAYQKVRQDGELHRLALMAALEGFIRQKGDMNASNCETPKEIIYQKLQIKT